MDFLDFPGLGGGLEPQPERAKIILARHGLDRIAFWFGSIRGCRRSTAAPKGYGFLPQIRSRLLVMSLQGE